MTTNLPWKASLPFAVFFTRTNGGKMETTSRQTQCSVYKILQRYIKELRLTVLLVLTVFNMANLFLLSRKAFVMCYCFCVPIKTFFFDACQMTVKSYVLHLFPVPQTGRSHIINILLVSFFPSAWAINRWKKTRSVIYSTDRKLG